MCTAISLSPLNLKYAIKENGSRGLSGMTLLRLLPIEIEMPAQQSVGGMPKIIITFVINIYSSHTS
jgi:hypothetical protein